MAGRFILTSVNPQRELRADGVEKHGCRCAIALVNRLVNQEIRSMMGPRQVAQGALFYELSIEDEVPGDHLLRRIDRFIDFSGIRSLLAPFYSVTGRPSIDPELMIRMLLVGCSCGIRSERHLCEEVPLNPAYRWFCRFDLTDPIPDPPTFSKNRNARFRDRDLFRRLFEDVLARYIAEGLVGGDHFGVDASFIKADASRYTKVEAAEWTVPAKITRATQEYLDTLYDAALRGATPTQPNAPSPSDPAARFTGVKGDRAFFAYDHTADQCTCPGGKPQKPSWRNISKGRPDYGKDGFKRCDARKQDCAACPLKPRCVPNQKVRRIARSKYESVRQMARGIAQRDAYVASSYVRKNVEMPLKRILRLDRLRLRGPNGARDGSHLAAMVQNLRKLAKFVPRPS